jgi:hypothetical protein
MLMLLEVPVLHLVVLDCGKSNQGCDCCCHLLIYTGTAGVALQRLPGQCAKAH